MAKRNETRDAPVSSLVEKLKSSEIRLPEMQRGYVWSSTQVRDLMDSLYRGYPSGTILTWRTSRDVEQRELAIHQENGSRQNFELLLDGQQRLTSLSLLLRGEKVEVKNRVNPIDLLFNLEHPEDPDILTSVEEDDQTEASEQTEGERTRQDQNRIFVVSQRKYARQRQWIPVTEIFADDSASKTLRKRNFELDDPMWDEYVRRIDQVRLIKSYVYRVETLPPEMSYDEVTEIFVRVNSLGTKLRSSDLALAQITAIWPGSLKLFQGYQEQCASRDFIFDLGIIVRSLVVIAKGKAGLKDQVKFNNIQQLRQKVLAKILGEDEGRTRLRDQLSSRHRYRDRSPAQQPLYRHHDRLSGRTPERDIQRGGPGQAHPLDPAQQYEGPIFPGLVGNHSRAGHCSDHPW